MSFETPEEVVLNLAKHKNVSGYLFLVKRSGKAQENHFSIVDGKVTGDPAWGLVYAGIGGFWPQAFADIGKQVFPLGEVLDCVVLSRFHGGEVCDGCISDVGIVSSLGGEARRHSVHGTEVPS